MIQTKKDLKEYIEADNQWFQMKNTKEKLIACLANYPGWHIRRYLRYLRKQEYYINTADGNKIKGMLGLFYERKKNALGFRLGIEIGPNCFGKGLSIYHAGNIVVNTAVKAGRNCKLHGGNCIGNNGKNLEVPILGDNIDIGYGAVLIGDITIADNVTIGANAVVNKSVDIANSVVVGIPGKIIK